MSSSITPIVTAPSVPKSVLIGIYWAGTVLSLIVFLVRLYIRQKVFGHFKTDDYLVAAAWCLLFVCTVTWTVLGEKLYVTIDAAAGDLEYYAVVSYLKVYAQALHANLGVYFCTWTSLYLIKLSFMVFFRHLSDQIRTQRILWWCVLAFIIASYAVSVGMFDYSCLTANWEHIIEKCTRKGALDYQVETTRVSTSVDVVTDALIMTIPGNIVWKSKMPLRKKLMLAAICSVTAFMMLCAIIRIGVGTKGKSNDLSWFHIWNGAEMTLAILVACVASFRSLYTKAKNTRQYQRGPGFEIPLEPRPFRNAILQTQTFSGVDTLIESENSLWMPHASQNSQEDLWNPNQAQGVTKTTQAFVSHTKHLSPTT